MADITIAGKRYPKTAIYAGGAAVVGIVGYAWWTRGVGTDEEEPTTEELIDTLGDERITPTTVDTYDVNVDTRVSPRNNAEWGNAAVDRLITEGYTATAVRSAIGKFLQRKPLNKIEADPVRAAISAAGMPPEHGPWIIIEEPAPTTPTTPPPTGSVRLTFNAPSVTKTSIKFRWNRVPGATYYTVSPKRGQAAGGGNLALRAVARTEWDWFGLHPGYAYGVTVSAYNKDRRKIASAFQDARTLR